MKEFFYVKAHRVNIVPRITFIINGVHSRLDPGGLI